MSEQTLKFDGNVVNKKDFHAFKQAIALNLVDSSKILVSDKLNLVMMAVNTSFAIYMMMM